MTISGYLTFSGNCREAMTFYRDCLGGELYFQAVGETPLADKMPDKMKRAILHARLSRNGFVLYGSDMVGEDGLSKGNAISLMLDCQSQEEIESCYRKLSEGGRQNHPLETTFWGAMIGNLTDKYGNPWLLHYGNAPSVPL